MGNKDGKIIYSCSVHVEQAIDDYVNFNEAAPQILITNKVLNCTYCDKKAKYKITE
ncbi:MAG: CxxH/CxxC protein [Tissierellia bacterium]|nr:CxxH/CxxC protein [Tissierellia bacterium]